MDVLLEVAANFRALGDRENELDTLRNAALFATGLRDDPLPVGLWERIVEVCEAIEPGGLATELTRLHAELVHRAHERGE